MSKLAEITKLDWQGVVPVCSWCKKIRDPNGEWLTLEAFFHKYLEAVCTHTMCEECRDRQYADFFKGLQGL